MLSIDQVGLQSGRMAAMATVQNEVWPRCGASIAVFRSETVLMIARAKPPLVGRWSLPGGHVEAGEPTRDAALRELKEETGIEARIDGLADVVEVIHAPGGIVERHYVIAVFFGRWLAGEPVASSDAAAARFVPLEQVAGLETTDGAPAVIARAWRLAKAGSVAP